MPERIIEAIIILLSKLQENQIVNAYVNLSKELSTQGYTESEINLAFSWIFNHLKKDRSYDFQDDDFVALEDEFMDDPNEQILSPEAYGYLMQIVQLGMLSDNQVEEVIEKAVEKGGSAISTDEVKSIVANVLFDSDRINNTAFNSYFYNRGIDTLQ